MISIKVEGHSNERLLFRPLSGCGSIEDGVAFEHKGEGGWVIAFKDLERMYKAACKARRKEPKP